MFHDVLHDMFHDAFFTTQVLLWEHPDICHSHILGGMGRYCEEVGLPPVETGRRSPKKSRKRRGHTRGQVALIRETNEKRRIDLSGLCILVVYAEYATRLNIEDESDAAMAVLIELQKPEVFKRIMASVIT